MGATLAKLFIDPNKFGAASHGASCTAVYASALNVSQSDTNDTNVSLHHFNDIYASCLDDLAEEGKLGEGFYGIFQLLFLMGAYAMVLMNAATLIGDGAELLLLVPEYATLVGTLVLPILGAVPDGAIVLFSGMGKGAQEQLSVGMGALAGSTIMLLTIPWFLAVYAGRVNIVNGECQYKPKKGEKKLSEGQPMGSAGVATDAAVPNSCTIMLITCITYVIIQCPALSKPKLVPKNGSHGDIANEKTFALIGMICSASLFVLVCIYQVRAGSSEAAKDVIDGAVERKQKQALDDGTMTFTGIFRETICKTIKDQTISAPLMGSSESSKKVRHFLKPYFHKYDTDSSDSMDVHEIRQLFKDLGETASPDYIQDIINEYDEDKSGDISFDEFCRIMIGYASGTSNSDSRTRNPVGRPLGLGAGGSIQGGEAGQLQGTEDDGADESEEEDEEIPEDLAHLSPEEQQTRIKRRALWQMFAGTVLCLLFSDPMVDCLGALGDVTNIPPFYISFILAPLASNGTELLAAYSFALKKTKKSITVSLSQLEGAAIMNNTFCLAIFLFLIWSGGGSFGEPLEWAYTAEVAAILFVQLAVGAFARKSVITLFDAWLILALYPISLVLVIILEVGLKLD